MYVNRHSKLFGLTLWSLLSIWAAFGSFEFAEAIEVLDEIVTRNATHQDLDEQALAQLASGIKSDVLALDAVRCATCSIAFVSATPSCNALTYRQSPDLIIHGPPFLPRYQQFSVYRI